MLKCKESLQGCTRQLPINITRQYRPQPPSLTTPPPRDHVPPDLTWPPLDLTTWPCPSRPLTTWPCPPDHRPPDPWPDSLDHLTPPPDHGPPNPHWSTWPDPQTVNNTVLEWPVQGAVNNTDGVFTLAYSGTGTRTGLRTPDRYYAEHFTLHRDRDRESTPENACLHALNKDPNKTCAFVMLFNLRRNVFNR